MLVSIAALALMIVDRENQGGLQLDSCGRTKTFVWLYRFPQLQNQELIRNLTIFRVSGVFLSVSAFKLDPNASSFEPAYVGKMLDFLRLAKDRNIGVHAIVADDPAFTFLKNHIVALDRLNAVLNFNQDHPGLGFSGIQLDVEPFALDIWKSGSWSERELLLKEYIELLFKARQSIGISGQSTVLSTTVAWWYGEAETKQQISAASWHGLLRYVDWVVPLVYGISPEQIPEMTKRLQPFFNSSKVVLGLKADDYANYEMLSALISQFSRNLCSQKNLIGFAIFEYDRLSAMMEEVGATSTQVPLPYAERPRVNKQNHDP